jgi:hypothetical protein
MEDRPKRASVLMICSVVMPRVAARAQQLESRCACERVGARDHAFGGRGEGRVMHECSVIGQLSTKLTRVVT